MWRRISSRNQTVRLKPLATGIRFVESPAPPTELGDRRLTFEAQVRGGGEQVEAVALLYRAGATGGFRRVPLERVANDSERYAGVVPELMPGTLVQYYFEARGGDGEFVLTPEDAPSRLLTHTVGDLEWVPVYAADFESDTGDFVVGGSEDRGESGIWERARPVASAERFALLRRSSRAAERRRQPGGGGLLLRDRARHAGRGSGRELGEWPEHHHLTRGRPAWRAGRPPSRHHLVRERSVRRTVAGSVPGADVDRSGSDTGARWRRSASRASAGSR